MHTMMPFPWQMTLWDKILDAYRQKKLPHALLLSGQQGIGKKHLARAVSRFLLCQGSQNGSAECQCRACQLFDAETHPDYFEIEPEDKSKAIKIDQIRKVGEAMAATAQQGGYKVVLLSTAEQLNVNAANALLKNLEEPASDTLIILISHVSSLVMPTIKSRCQQMLCPTPNTEQSQQWLAQLGYSQEALTALHFSAGAPLLAKALLSDNELDVVKRFVADISTALMPDSALMTLAESWLDIELSRIIDWWLQALTIMLKPLNRGSDAINQQAPFLQTLTQQIASMDSKAAFHFYDRLLDIKRAHIRGANFNKQLLIEELFLDWYAVGQNNPSVNAN